MYPPKINNFESSLTITSIVVVCLFFLCHTNDQCIHPSKFSAERTHLNPFIFPGFITTMHTPRLFTTPPDHQQRSHNRRIRPTRTNPPCVNNQNHIKVGFVHNYMLTPRQNPTSKPQHQDVHSEAATPYYNAHSRYTTEAIPSSHQHSSPKMACASIGKQCHYFHYYFA